jgi:hypothetical protein
VAGSRGRAVAGKNRRRISPLAGTLSAAAGIPGSSVTPAIAMPPILPRFRSWVYAPNQQMPVSLWPARCRGYCEALLMYCFTHWAEAEDHEADDTCSDALDVGHQNRGVIAPMPMYA